MASRILLIDDDALIRSSYTLALRKWGVVAVGTADEARSTLEANPEVELVVCDLHLEDTHGQDVYEMVQDMRADLAGRFVMMSGLFLPQDEAFLEQHQLHVFQKPGSLQGLRELVVGILGAPTA